MRQQPKWYWRDERGSNVAQTAAVALLAAALLGAMLFIVPSFRASVSQSFACLVGAIGGGGGGCGGSAQPTTAQSQPPAESENEDAECSGLCQVGGFFKGIGEGVVDTAKGLWTLGSDAVKYAAGDDETREKYAALVESFQSDPWGTTKAVGEAIVEPIVTDWQEGRYGEAIGRGVFEVVSTIGGPKGLDKLGKLGKVDDIARVAGKADEIADVGRATGKIDDVARAAERFDELPDAVRTAERLPCVSAAPSGKTFGLAAPNLASCIRINVDHIFHGEINRRGRAVGFHHRVSIGHEGKARIIPGTETAPNAQGVFQARVEVFNPATNTWVTKNAPSTFFPDSWNRGQVLTEIRGAHSNATFPDPGRPNYWEGVSPSGVRIGGYLDNAGNINTAFPIP